MAVQVDISAARIFLSPQRTQRAQRLNLLGANYAEDADLRLRCVSDFQTQMARMTQILRLRCVSDFLDADGADDADFFGK